jgi:hypothetical protein
MNHNDIKEFIFTPFEGVIGGLCPPKIENFFCIFKEDIK